MCGERNCRAVRTGENFGSSPRVRGTQARDWMPCLRHRFIPACAGNASSENRSSSAVTVHPRVCGERAGNPTLRRVRNGSSPRVRGTLARMAQAGSERRFIPACAGNASRRFIMHPRYSVHPRVCGERAKLLSAGMDDSRFIPACAGNAVCLHHEGARRKVHPRVCGERAVWGRRPKWCVGSSPRVRGTQPSISSSHYSLRFIPACAGNASR